MNQNFPLSSSLNTSDASKCVQLESHIDIARILTELFDPRQLPPASAVSNARELQYFAMGLQTAVRALSLPTEQGSNTSDCDPERKIDPDSVEGSLLAHEGETAA